MLERDLERACRRLAETNGAMLLKWVSPGNRGVPDRILVHKGRIALIEFKQQKGSLSPIQRVMHEKLTTCGVGPHVIRDLEAFRILLIALSSPRG